MRPSNGIISARRACTVGRKALLIRSLLVVAALFFIGMARNIHHDVMEESLQYVAKVGFRSNVKPDPQDNVVYKPDWTKAIGAKDDLFVYSAFLDSRIDPPSVRVVALALREAEVFVECSFWTSSNHSVTTQGRVRLLHESHDLEYGAAFVECPLLQSWNPEYPGAATNYKTSSVGTSHSETHTEEENIKIQKVQDSESVAEIDWLSITQSDPVVRVAVSISQGKSNNFPASIPVENLTNRRQRGKLNVCVKQMHSHYNNAASLVEFIELQKLLGADHFTFYSMDTGPDVDRVLQHYVKEGLAEVLPFTAPVLRDEVSYHDRGTIACLNDCILRSAGRYPLAAVVDVDEFIVPRDGGDLVQLVDELGHHTEYNAKNAFFYTFFNDDESTKSDKPLPPEGESGGQPFLLTQSNTRRLVSAHKHNVRSKYLCRPEKVYAAGNHFVHTFFEGESVMRIPEERALCHHYRSCEWDTPTCTSRPTMVDTTMHRFREPLTDGVVSACRTIFPARPGCRPRQQ